MPWLLSDEVLAIEKAAFEADTSAIDDGSETEGSGVPIGGVSPFERADSNVGTKMVGSEDGREPVLGLNSAMTSAACSGLHRVNTWCTI